MDVTEVNQVNDSYKYNVVTTGELVEGFELGQVQRAFADLFKCPLEKAEAVVGKRVTLKKNLDSKAADAYRSRLKAIGLLVHLEEIITEPASITLSLEPIGDALDSARANANNVAVPQNASSAPSATMVCPKCNLEQPRAEQCEGCGVYIHKVMAAQQETTTKDSESKDHTRDDSGSDIAAITIETIPVKALAVAAVVAIVGAFLWKTIAIEFDRELGLIAWLIGGAVGFSAALMGSKGQTAGILCGVLTVFAILGGKYLFYSDLQANIQSVMEEMGTTELMQASYQQMQREAEEFVTIDDDQSLREFMVRNEYSEQQSPNEVTTEEIEIFREEFEADLVYLATNKPTYEEWVGDTIAPEVQSVSTLQVVYESLGWLDILFLLFGVATAYRLGSQERS
ncbi:MAG: hypothetical protein MI976_15950 [Pseudomonadales bacterium]|nr:hypothetical protein [Pseudomonadales bacterium]